LARLNPLTVLEAQVLDGVGCKHGRDAEGMVEAVDFTCPVTHR
jgi:hypothetical protein